MVGGEITIGSKVTIREGYTAHCGDEIYQGGETITVTKRNIDDLVLQSWKYEVLNGEKKVKTERIEEEDVDNRAILKPGSRARNRVKSGDIQLET